MSSPLYRYLDTDGDGGGTKQATGDYSVTPDDFRIVPPSDRIYHIERMIAFVEDASGFRAERYGSLGAALTNGIQVLHLNSDGTTKEDLTDGLPIKTNAEWGRTCYDAEVKTWGAGDEVLLVRWTFSKAGLPLVIDGRFGEEFVVRLSDSFVGLVEHTFQVQGRDYYLNEI